MLIQYTFTADEITVLDKARHVFNRFTGKNFTIQQYIKFTVECAVSNEVETARLINEQMGAPVQFIAKKVVRHATH